METAEEKVDVREDASLDLEIEEKVDVAVSDLATAEKLEDLVSDLIVAADLEIEKKAEAVSEIVEAALATAKKAAADLVTAKKDKEILLPVLSVRAMRT